MSTIAYKKTYSIDSKDRSSGEHEDFSIEIDIPKDKTYDMVCLSRAVIPKTYYLVQDGHNTFVLEEKGVQTTITIPKADYTRSNFKTKCQALLNDNSPNGWTYTIAVPDTTQEGETGKYTFTVAGN